MITYTDGQMEAIILGIQDNEWVVGVYSSFDDFCNCRIPIEIKKFKGTPNRTAILESFPGWRPKVRDKETWVILEDSDDDLPLLSEVPKSVSARQIRLWLITHGFTLDQVDTAINSIEDSSIKNTVKIEWEYAPYIERTHPWLVPLAESLGLNIEQIDQAFREASTI
ncbi:MAG: hypothetical protein EBU90_05925 [Proteobacteria bacterium]|nr:hypothetical protein [Pseudomonadota bacterium]NBP15047.1 hypothetical protein [bacterium]